jgi:hypothetical protein
MARTRILRARRVASFAAAAAVAAFVASPASAFYFRGWPGDGVPRDRNLVAPKDRFTDTRPGRTTDRPPGPDDFPPGPSGPPQPPGSATPEPGSVVLAAIGLGLVGVLRRKLRRR